MSGRPLRIARAVAVALTLVAVGAASPAGAEERTVRAFGVFGFTPPKNLTTQRQNAVTEGIRAAVYQVVAELLPALDEEAAGAVARRVVGSRARSYVTRFQVVEDRGVSEKTYSTNRSATHEYLVVVEASVDAGALRNRLVSAGMLASGGSLRRVDLTLLDLPSYAAYEAVREALVDQLQAEAAVPVEFTQRRAVLAVTTRGDGRRLLERLGRLELAGFRVEPREAGDDRAVAAVRAR
jgi:hypothetical protein